MKWLFVLTIFLFPLVVSAEPGCDGSYLAWDHVDGAYGYFVYWRNNSQQYDNNRRVYIGYNNVHPLGGVLKPEPQSYLLLESGERTGVLLEYSFYMTVTAFNGCESDYADEIEYWGGGPLEISW